MVHFALLSAVILAYFARWHRQLFTFAAFALLAVFFSIRYMYGNDYYNYSMWYTRIQQGVDSPYDYEYIFTFLNHIFPSFYLLIAAITCFFTFGFYRFISHHLNRYYLFIGVFIFVINPYIFLINLSAIRQSIAIVIFLVASHFLYKRKFIPYFLAVVVSALFHKSAWLLLPVYFIVTPKKVSLKWGIIFSSIVLAFVIFAEIPALTTRVISIFGDKEYNIFASSDRTNSLRATLLTSIYFVYVIGNISKLEGKYLVYAKLYSIGLAFGILAFRLSMLTRYQMYFDVFSVVVLPCIFSKTIQIRISNELEQSKISLIWNCINKYALPVMIFAVYLLRYYSFFNNPMWRSFGEYNTIFSLFEV